MCIPLFNLLPFTCHLFTNDFSHVRGAIFARRQKSAQGNWPFALARSELIRRSNISQVWGYLDSDIFEVKYLKWTIQETLLWRVWGYCLVEVLKYYIIVFLLIIYIYILIKVKQIEKYGSPRETKLDVYFLSIITVGFIL